MLEWTHEALLCRFGMPADWVASTPADLAAFEARCIDLMRDPANRSGFKEVHRRKDEKQHQLGRFDTELEAAKVILWWRISGDKLKSPKKGRNKRGEGRRKTDRRKGACRLLSFPSLMY